MNKINLAAAFATFDDAWNPRVAGDINGFPQLVKFWRSSQGPFAKLPVTEWQTMFAKAAA